MSSKVRAIALLGVVICGCPSASIYKVENGRTVGPDGMRFYRPRPYVAVKKPFPVAGSDVLLNGEVKDGYVVIDKSGLGALSKECADLLPVAEGDRRLVPTNAVAVSRAFALQAQSDSGGKKGDENADGKAATGKNGDEDSKAPVGASVDGAAADGGKTQGTSVTVASDPASNPLQVLNDVFDIVYLPDFDEDYVMNVDARAGLAEASFVFGNGWMLQKAEIKTDGSSIANVITDVAKRLLDKALPLPTSGSDEGSSTETLADTEKAEGFDLQAEEVLRVVVRAQCLLEAQPGLYPVLKPREFSQNTGSHPHQGLSSAGSVFVPYPPFTVVAYNVVRTLRLEAISAKPGAPAPSAASDSSSRAIIGNELVEFKKWLEQNWAGADGKSLSKLLVAANLGGKVMNLVLDSKVEEVASMTDEELDSKSKKLTEALKKESSRPAKLEFDTIVLKKSKP